MSKNYEIIHFIQEQAPNKTISDIITRLFTRLDAQTIYASALSTSISIVLAAALYDIKADLILGTIGIPGTGSCFPSAWVEIDGKIYDLSIYFDTLRHPVLKEHVAVVKPQINKDYNDTDLDYFDFQFSDVYELSDIKRTVDKSFKEFCNNSPNGDDIWCDILYAANLNQTQDNLNKLQNLASNILIKDER